MNDPLRKDLQSLQETIRLFDGHSGIRKLMEDQRHQQEALRAALGPYEDIRRSMQRLHADLNVGRFAKLAEDMAATHARYRLPESSEVARLAKQLTEGAASTWFKRRQDEAEEVARLSKQLSEGAASTWFKRQQEEAEAIQRAVASIRAPWLDMQDKFRSFSGLAELQGIGYALRTLPSFDVQLAERLRLDLGDWRAEINWPTTIFDDPIARTSFYARQGLDPGLTAFPAEAFEESVGLAGLRESPPPFALDFRIQRPEETPGDEEQGFRRTNVAHDRLQRFESQLRRFIAEQMQSRFGDKWIKQRVPGEIWKKWAEKREKARENGEPSYPLIAYADFTDYVPIITRADNWTDVFEPVFCRTTSVQESFQRLYPIRICTMHARIITQDDELYLYVETKRILAAIGVKI